MPDGIQGSGNTVGMTRTRVPIPLGSAFSCGTGWGILAQINMELRKNSQPVWTRPLKLSVTPKWGSADKVPPFPHRGEEGGEQGGGRDQGLSSGCATSWLGLSPSTKAEGIQFLGLLVLCGQEPGLP